MSQEYIIIVRLKKNILCHKELLSKKFLCKYEDKPLTIHFPQQDSNHKDLGKLLPPKLLEKAKLLNQTPWGEMIGPIIKPGTDIMTVVSGGYKEKLQYHPSIKSLCIQFPSADFGISNPESYASSFSDELISHFYNLINHNISTKYSERGNTTEIIAGPSLGMSSRIGSATIHFPSFNNFATELQFTTILMKIEKNMSPSTEQKFLSQAWKDLYDENYRAAILHASLSC